MRMEQVIVLLENAEQRIYEIRSGRDSSALTPLSSSMVETLTNLQKISGPDADKYKGIPTGFRLLDTVLTGLGRGDLVILAARPGMGKTSFALNIATRVAMQQKVPVAIFSLEMTKEQLTNRILSSEAGIDSQAFRTGALRAEDWEYLALATEKLHDAPIYMDDTSGITITEMEGRFRHQDVRSRTASSLANQYNIDSEQARRVLETTMQMYDQWHTQQPKLANPQLEALLRWAAMLHEVGLNINHSGLHRHSAYILQNSDLPGFNQEQQLMMATLVRYHRKAIKLDDLPRFTLFKKKQFLPLIQLLRLGVLLNNQRQATTTPPTLTLITDDSHWTLRFPHDWFSQNALVLLDLEKEQEYWEGVAGWRLKIEEESTPEIAA